LSKAKRNPLGRSFPGVTVVTVGNGTLTHIWHPVKRQHLCGSGINAGRIKDDGTDNRGKAQDFYRSKAKYITCWRCEKLGMMNESEGRAAWQSED
jgi:hypothetical protein